MRKQAGVFKTEPGQESWYDALVREGQIRPGYNTQEYLDNNGFGKEASFDAKMAMGKLVKLAFQNPLNLYGQYMQNNMGAMSFYNNANANMAQNSMPQSMPNQGLPNPQPQGQQTPYPSNQQKQMGDLNKPAVNVNMGSYKPFQPYGMGGTNYIKY